MYVILPLEKDQGNYFYILKILGSWTLVDLINCLLSVCLATKLCLIVCDPLDSSPLGFCVLGNSQPRMSEWVVASFSRWSSQSRDSTWVSCTGRQILYHWATREAHTNSLQSGLFFIYKGPEDYQKNNYI